METKELKIQVPEGYEIDKGNSTFECIRFRPIKKYIAYEDVCNKIFANDNHPYFINNWGYIHKGLLPDWDDEILSNKNIATNREQLKRILALNQLLNIAEYYNRLDTTNIKNDTTIEYDGVNQIYYISSISTKFMRGISAIFNRREDAQAVINNPNFREILDTIYK